MKKSIKMALGLLFVLSLNNCGKEQRNEKLAQNYYKLSMLELSNENTGDSQQISYRKALAQIDKALEQIQKPEYLALKATLLFKLNECDESKNYFQQALAVQPSPTIRAEILNNYACLLAQNGKEDEAFALWRALENDHHYLTPEVSCFNQGKVYALKGDHAHAKEYFLKSVTLAPNYLDAQYYLAVSAYQAKDLALAKESVKTLLFLEPNHPGGQFLAKKLGLAVALQE